MRFYAPRRSLASLLFMLLLGGFIGWKSALYTVRDDLSLFAEPTPTATTESTTPLDLSLFWEVYDSLQNDYVNATAFDAENQTYGAIKGLVKSLDDPYTEFLDPEEAAEFQQALDGTLQGIGAELTVKDGELVVISPIKGSPAETAGLQPGDIVYMIDDQYAADLSLFEAIMAIRGEAGTTVQLTLIREGVNEPVVLTIERAEIQVPEVELAYKGANEDIAYVSVFQFNDSTATEFEAAVQQILLSDVKAIILDLRDNGGGYMEVAVKMLSDFVEGKQVATVTKHRDEAQNEIFYTNESARLADLPLVVLVNKGSASASEILAGAIQDYGVGILIGEQTFGKGSVQIVQPLGDGSTLRMTIAKWYTPNDRSIDEVGITPDTLVENTPEDFANGIDAQLDAAVTYLEELE